MSMPSIGLSFLFMVSYEPKVPPCLLTRYYIWRPAVKMVISLTYGRVRTTSKLCGPLQQTLTSTSCRPWISRDIHPLGGFRSPSLASRTKMAPAETPDVIMTLVSYFCGLPGVPQKARKHWHYRAGFALKVTICRNNVTPLFADAAR